MSGASSSAGGATEHTVERGKLRRVSASSNEWQVAVAFSNIGLPGEAIDSDNWGRKHRPRLKRLLKQLLDEEVVGILLCEVGNMSDLVTTAGKALFEDLIREVFHQSLSDAMPQIYWTEGGETLAMFRHEALVERLSPLTKMYRVDNSRSIDRFVLTGVTEHGTYRFLLFNNHQPK